jgi:iron complex outermembrane recepter protein
MTVTAANAPIFRADWQIDHEHRLEFHAGMVRLKASIGYESDYENPVRPLQHRAAFGQVRWRWQPTPDEELNLTVYQQETSMRDGFRVNVSDVVPVAPPQWYVDVDYDNRIRRSDIELEHTFSPGTGMRHGVGAGLSGRPLACLPDLPSRPDPLPQRTPVCEPRVAGHAAMARQRRNHGRARQLFRNVIGAAARSELPSIRRHTLRASVGRAYRRLTPFEHDADMRFYEANTGILLLQTAQPSPDVRPERITVRELGYRAELAQRSISVDVRLFEERIDRLIRRDNVATDPPPLLDPEPSAFSVMTAQR